MVLSAVLQITTVVIAVLTLVWHQTRTVDRLRREVRSDHKHLLKLHNKATRQARRDNEKLRREFIEANGKLRREMRREMRREFTKLWDAVIHNSRKLDRIEGFLGIGMPPPVAGRAPGAASVPHHRHEDPPEPAEHEPQQRRPEDSRVEPDESD